MSGAAQTYQLPTDATNTGKKVQVFENSISGQTVEAQAVVIVDPNGVGQPGLSQGGSPLLFGGLGYATAPGSSSLTDRLLYNTALQATVQGTGALTASVNLYATNDPATIASTASAWVYLGNITLSGSGIASDALPVPASANYPYFMATVVSITGTSAQVRVTQSA
jgi:hypothetical protein